MNADVHVLHREPPFSYDDDQILRREGQFLALVGLEVFQEGDLIFVCEIAEVAANVLRLRRLAR